MCSVDSVSLKLIGNGENWGPMSYVTGLPDVLTQTRDFGNGTVHQLHDPETFIHKQGEFVYNSHYAMRLIYH